MLFRSKYVRYKKYRSKNRSSPVDTWICDAVDSGLNVIGIILEANCIDEYRIRERWWIRHLREQGYDLLNVQDGGTRGFTHQQHTPEIKKKISLSLTGQKRGPHSQEHRRKISDAKRGKTSTPETRKKLSEAHLGQVPWNKGKKLLPHQHRGVPWSQDQRIKIQQAWDKSSRTDIPCSQCSKICHGPRGLAVHVGHMHVRR